MGKSGFGPGMNAGGPNYVAQFMSFEDTGRVAQHEVTLPPTLSAFSEGLAADPLADDAPLAAAIRSYQHACDEEFAREHDHFLLVGQDNVRRYLPIGRVCVRVHPDDSAFETAARACAAHVAGCRVVVSTPPGLDSLAVRRLDVLTESWAGAIEFVEQSDAALTRSIREGRLDRVRYAAPQRVPDEVQAAGNAANGCIVSRTVSAEGRLELLWYLREQSLSVDYHRYGNLGVRAGEERAPVA